MSLRTKLLEQGNTNFKKNTNVLLVVAPLLFCFPQIFLTLRNSSWQLIDDWLISSNYIMGQPFVREYASMGRDFMSLSLYFRILNGLNLNSPMALYILSCLVIVTIISISGFFVFKLTLDLKTALISQFALSLMTSLPEVLNGLLALEGKVFGGLMIFLSIWSRAIKNGNYGGGLGKKRISQFLVIGIVFFISIWISKEFIFLYIVAVFVLLIFFSINEKFYIYLPLTWNLVLTTSVGFLFYLVYQSIFISRQVQPGGYAESGLQPLVVTPWKIAGYTVYQPDFLGSLVLIILIFTLALFKFSKKKISSVGYLRSTLEGKTVNPLDLVRIVIGFSLIVFSITGFFFLVFVWRYVQIRYSFPFTGSAIIAVAILWNYVTEQLESSKVTKRFFFFFIIFVLIISAFTSLGRGYTLALSRNMDRELTTEVSSRISSGQFSRLYVNFPTGSELIAGINALQANGSTETALPYESIDLSSSSSDVKLDANHEKSCRSLVALNLRDTGMEGVGWAGRFFTAQWDYNSQLKWLQKQDNLKLVFSKNSIHRLFLPFSTATDQFIVYSEIARSIKPSFTQVTYGWSIYEFTEACRATK